MEAPLPSAFCGRIASGSRSPGVIGERASSGLFGLPSAPWDPTDGAGHSVACVPPLEGGEGESGMTRKSRRGLSDAADPGEILDSSSASPFSPLAGKG